MAVGVVSSGRDRSFSQPTKCNIAARGVAKGGSDPERLRSLGVSGTAVVGEKRRGLLPGVGSVGITRGYPDSKWQRSYG